MHLLRYKSTTGLAAFSKIKAGGLGTQPLGTATWTKSWTTFSPFTLAGKGHFLAYKTGTGKVDVDVLNAGGSGISTVWSGWWALGWA